MSCSSAYASSTLTWLHRRFGGTDGQYHYNDTWRFDLATRKWSELTCIGFIPSPREGHAAALVDDVMYVFGGRGVDGKDLGDLAAFKISSAYQGFLRSSFHRSPVFPLQINGGICSRIWGHRQAGGLDMQCQQSARESLSLEENRLLPPRQRILI